MNSFTDIRTSINLIGNLSINNLTLKLHDKFNIVGSLIDTNSILVNSNFVNLNYQKVITNNLDALINNITKLKTTHYISYLIDKFESNKFYDISLNKSKISLFKESFYKFLNKDKLIKPPQKFA